MTVEAPRLSGTIRYAPVWAFVGTSTTGGYGSYTTGYTDTGSSSGGSFQPAPVSIRLTRYTAEPYTGQGGPYTPIPFQKFCPLNVHTTTLKSVRTIESFLAVGETLHGDGITDDSVVMNACIRRAVVASRTTRVVGTPAELVVSLTRTYLCDDTIFIDMAVPAPGQPGRVQPSPPLVGLQITGPGQTTRTYNGWRARQTAGLPIEPCWQPQVAQKVKLQSFAIKSFRQDSARNKDKDLEGDRGIFWVSCQDVEARAMSVTNTMGDSVAFGRHNYAADSVAQNSNARLYGGHYKNSGRLMVEPLASDLDVYGILWEINASSVLDIEVTGNPYRPTDPENGLRRIRVRNVIHHDKDGGHGSFFHIPAIGSGGTGSLGNSPNTFDVEVKECIRYGGIVGMVAGGDVFHNQDPGFIGWQPIYSQDFATSVGLGQLFTSGVYGPSIGELTGPDTSGHGVHSQVKTCSVTGGHLNVSMHTESGVHYGAALFPIIGGNRTDPATSGRQYGRCTIKWRCDSLAGYRVAAALLPDSGSGLPFYNPLANCDGHVFAQLGFDVRDTGVNATTSPGVWHTSVTEWRPLAEATTTTGTPALCRFYLDGVQIGATITTSVPTASYHWVLLFETAIDGTIPADGTTGNIQVDQIDVAVPAIGHVDWTMAGWSWHDNIWSNSESNLGGGVDLNNCRNVNMYNNFGPLMHGSSIGVPSLAAQINLAGVFEDGDEDTVGTNAFTESEYIARNPGVFVNPTQYDVPHDLS